MDFIWISGNIQAAFLPPPATFAALAAQVAWPETAEAYVRAYAAIQTGDGPDKSSKRSSFDGDDPLAYIEQTIGK